MSRTAYVCPMRAVSFGFLLISVATSACDSEDKLGAALPELPPTGGPVVAAAGRLTDANFATEHIDGPAAQGLVGDFFIRNDRVRFVVQAPGRAIGPCPFGGNVIDADFVDQPVGDQLGEVSPFFQLGRTLNPIDAQIVRDGSDGGAAVLRFTGRDAWDDFINIRGLGSFAGIILDDGLPSVELGWKIAVTYILSPGDTHLRAIYTFYNTQKQARATTWGSLSDTGADIEIFHPGSGFGEVGVDSILSGKPQPLSEYAAFQGRNVAYGVVPILADLAARGAAVPVAGVNVDVYQVSQLFDAFSDAGRSLTVPADGTASRELAILLARDTGDVTAQAHALRGEPTMNLAGTVTGDNAEGARVSVSLMGGPDVDALKTVFVAGVGGSFGGSLPPGTYQIEAEGEGYVRSGQKQVTVPATNLSIALPSTAIVRYTVHDRAGEAIPAKIVAVGTLPSVPSSRFRDVTKDVLPRGIASWAHTLSGISSDKFDKVSGADRPLRVAPGMYRFVVSRGPEWSRDDRTLVVPAGGLTLDATLDHVSPTPGFAACDFHQHNNKSPDSPVPPEARVLSYLAEGVDFASSSDHDMIFDLHPVIDKVGATGMLDTAVGIETTTWDYGHYIAFPLVVDPNSPNGGALDWAGGENIDGAGLNLPPPVIFDKLHAAGAKVVQVTHPRATPGSSTNFQQSFDRAGLRFDFGSRSFFGDVAIMPVTTEILALPPDAQMFSTGFDTVEVYNGFHPITVDGERLDQKAEVVLRDWMNFLSFGFTPVPTGVSDTHTWIADPAGMPRTLVAVPDDSPAAVAAGLKDQVATTLTGAGGAPRNVIVTNGPFVQFTVDGASPGRTVAHASGPLAIHVEVHSPLWAPIDTVEIFANSTFDVPSSTVQPLLPALCFTNKPTPSARCAAAIGGARPLSEAQVVTVNGVPSSTRRDIVIDATVTPAELAARNRVGATGSDLWLVARAAGTQALYPSLPNEVTKTPIANLIAGTPILDEGVPPMAFTSPVFVDVDGGGWRGPFAP